MRYLYHKELHLQFTGPTGGNLYAGQCEHDLTVRRLASHNHSLSEAEQHLVLVVLQLYLAQKIKQQERFCIHTFFSIAE
jgi:hypothetical protein